MLGEIGLILLVIEAGININLVTLKLIGSRGLIIAVTGNILSILLAFLLALAIGTDLIESLADGSCFRPHRPGHHYEHPLSGRDGSAGIPAVPPRMRVWRRPLASCA